MSTLKVFRDWVIHVNALVAVALECEAQLAEALARAELATKSEDRRAIERSKQESTYQRRQFELAVALLLDTTRTTTLEAVQELLTDVRMGILNATDLYEAWRKVELLIVLLETTQGFNTESGVGQLTQAEADDKAARLNQEYRVALAIVAKLIPTPQA